MPKIEKLELGVSDPIEHRDFYCGVMEMKDLGNGCVGYAPEQMGIRFIPAKAPYVYGQTDLYWKIAIAVPDLDLACAQLSAKGIDAATPRQFRDVGYLTKVLAPDGFTIELIQHVFKGETPPRPIDSLRLGGGPTLNLLTLRCHDAAPVISFCTERLGMRPLCVQPVDPFGFTLYFFAFTDELPPDPDLTAIANRSWTYQRPYSVLEVQHVHDAQMITRRKGDAAGYGGAYVSGVPFDNENVLGLVSERKSSQ
ncbi:MAG: VOC family protein [Paracoccaceae bacterium]